MNEEAITSAKPSTLRHAVVDGPSTCLFLREGPVAAQVILTTGSQPRWLAAFAAGNSGAALWFHPAKAELSWRVCGDVQPTVASDSQGRSLHGVEVQIETPTSELVVCQALLGSVRVLRDHQFDGRLPEFGNVAPQVIGSVVTWARDRLDGAAGYVLSVDVVAGVVELQDDGTVRLIAAGTTGLVLKLRALTGDEPLLTLGGDDLLTSDASDLPAARRCLEFLSYREKFLAGSWRFQTYFGRDTLMSLRLLMPVLKPRAIESALESVLVRLNAYGDVAHEEDIGEFPLLERKRRGLPLSAEPIYDYKMVDDDFMLLPVVAAYLLDSASGRERAAEFLARCDNGGTPFSVLLQRNAQCVLRKARPFVERPDSGTLVRLKDGEIVGDWRDSADGLAGGVIPYSVNAVLVPAALRAIEALSAAGLLTRHADSAGEPLDQAGPSAKIWEAMAPALFEVRIPTPVATRAVAAYAAQLGVPAAAALACVSELPVVFSAVALDAQGKALPVMHSDFGFELLFGHPSAQQIDAGLRALTQPFPAGLMTEVGLLVANACFADSTLQPLFGADRYHGAVIWSWQQALVAAGLQRQAARTDLPPATHDALTQAQGTLWRAIEATRAVANGELWSWTHDGERYRVQPFGPVCATADESNAAQLWSTVYLAVKPPST